MLKKILLMTAICATMAGCASNGPAFSAWEHNQPDGTKVYEVDCHGLFDGPGVCMRHARKICGDQPVAVVQAISALGATSSGSNGAVPDTRRLLFRCGVPRVEPVPVVEEEVAPPPPPPPRQLVLSDNTGANFDTGQAELKPQARARLDQFLAAAQDMTVGTVVVKGYTDSAGSDEYNLRLSQHRAQGVAVYLQAHGLRAAGYDVHGYGKADPVASNATPQGRAQNRRVEVTLMP